MMDNCRICKASVPQHQTFCSRCGARQVGAAARDTDRESILSRLKGFFNGVYYEVFRSDEGKEIDREFAAPPMGSWDAAIPRLERVIRQERNNPRIRARLAILYAGAGNERVGLWSDLGSSPLGKLHSPYYEEKRAEKAKEILSWVSKVRQLGEEEFSPYDEAWTGLDEALDGSLSLYDKSMDMNPTYPDGYSYRARAFQEVADGILEAYGIRPYRSLIDAEVIVEALVPTWIGQRNIV